VGTLVDTSVLIAAQRAETSLRAIVAAQGDQDLVTAAICAAELLHGPHRIGNAVARARAERRVEHLLTEIRVMDFNLDIARVHARLGADLAASGAPIGAHDLIIAATALFLDYRVATRDLRSFPKIPGLDVVRW
jgi:tRNA(fMet)-specific endonuclease VapC